MNEVQTLKQKALELYNNLTFNAFNENYDPTDMDEATQKRVRYIMMTRVQWYIDNHTSVNFTEALSIKDLDDKKHLEIIAALTGIEYSDVRSWWHEGGHTSFYERAEKARLEALRTVYRVNDEGFLQITPNNIQIVTKLCDATGWKNTEHSIVTLTERLRTQFNVVKEIITTKAVHNLV